MLKKEMIIKTSTGSKIIGNNNVITTNQQKIVNQQASY